MLLGSATLHRHVAPPENHMH
uniref:Uncharacterized protein n=1 Tax=Anguilla anguilla TaxID=7936 RepID=A0A0E9PYU2_ANGAN